MKFYGEVSEDCLYGPLQRSRITSPVYACYLSAKLLYFTLFFAARIWKVSADVALQALMVFVALVTVAAYLVRNLQRTRRRLYTAEFRTQLESREGIQIDNHLLVGMEEVRPLTLLNTGSANWDLGYLEARNGLTYIGDQASFQIPAENVLSLRVRGFRRPHIVAKVRLTAREEPVTLNFAPWACTSRTEALAALQQIRIGVLIQTGPPVLQTPRAEEVLQRA